MVDPIPVDEVPKDIGRNDPCPCGSGKKYKKCCFKTHRLQKETEKTTRSVDDLVTGETNPWEFVTTLQQVAENNLLNLAYDFIHADSPLRETYATTEAYIRGIADNAIEVFAREGYELVRIRHDDPDLLILLARGLSDPKFSSISFELLRLRDNGANDSGEPTGLRVWNVEWFDVSKDDVTIASPRFEEIGVTWSWQ